MMNFKQEELIGDIVDKVGRQFPEVELINVTESAEDPETLLINVTAPENEDRAFALMDFTGEMSADILMDYGYHILVIPTRRMAEAV